MPAYHSSQQILMPSIGNLAFLAIKGSSVFCLLLYDTTCEHLSKYYVLQIRWVDFKEFPEDLRRQRVPTKRTLLVIIKLSLKVSCDLNKLTRAGFSSC